MKRTSVCVISGALEFYNRLVRHYDVDKYNFRLYRDTYTNEEYIRTCDAFVIDATSRYEKSIESIPEGSPMIFIVPEDQPQLADAIHTGLVMYSPYNHTNLMNHINYMVESARRLTPKKKGEVKKVNKTQESHGCSQRSVRFNLPEYSGMLSYEGDVRGFVYRVVKSVGILMDTHKVMFIGPETNNVNSPWGVIESVGFEKKYEQMQLFPDNGLLELLLNDGSIMPSDHIGIEGDKYEPVSNVGMYVPVHGENGILGYILIGNRLSGKDYSEADIKLMADMTPYIAKTIIRLDKNSTNYMYGNLLSNMMEKLPHGVLLCSKDLKVVAVNSKFSEMTNLMDVSVLGKDIKVLGSVLSDIIIRTVQHGVTHTRATVNFNAIPGKYIVSSVPVGENSMFVFEKNWTCCDDCKDGKGATRCVWCQR